MSLSRKTKSKRKRSSGIETYASSPIACCNLCALSVIVSTNPIAMAGRARRPISRRVPHFGEGSLLTHLPSVIVACPTTASWPGPQSGKGLQAIASAPKSWLWGRLSSVPFSSFIRLASSSSASLVSFGSPSPREPPAMPKRTEHESVVSMYRRRAYCSSSSKSSPAMLPSSPNALAYRCLERKRARKAATWGESYDSFVSALSPLDTMG